MTQYSKYNLIYHLQKWMDSVPGQTFLNYGYSWGASVVILGALFKLTHLPGANIMLYFGMGTEVIVFFLSAFDRPFDKTDDGRELPTHVIEELIDDNENTVERPTAAPQAQYAAAENIAQSVQEVMPSANDIAAAVVGQQSKSIADAQQQTPEMVEAQTNYVAALQNLTEMLGKVNDQSQRLTRDSEEMENLNRTLTGIAKVYEMQLKSASQQIGTIDQINDQTRKMAQQIEQLNSIYARMIEAMTVNMRVAAPNVAPQQSTPESL
ncbi:type IX secretion system motor protein PorL/GldL [Prevotella melaninogenica]|uniref:type IX secretion system motor protein PorL/GldL n=1 Tax=Prevotella melaninogenica TaxID=28132 RepID=UPI001C5F8C34|nr:gliding motility protein GldL [Prevotella melaninogenica]MBW4728327.1 gliding motility protein GldL [Prevotella melaninogenica]MBW4730989.1 gliding motility protein GldL [Prevotella melaninogenica]MBW4749250.1 gliding motility protein GldL [Prevotella melaninogenica]